MRPSFPCSERIFSGDEFVSQRARPFHLRQHEEKRTEESAVQPAVEPDVRVLGCLDVQVFGSSDVRVFGAFGVWEQKSETEAAEIGEAELKREARPWAHLQVLRRHGEHSWRHPRRKAGGANSEAKAPYFSHNLGQPMRLWIPARLRWGLRYTLDRGGRSGEDGSSSPEEMNQSIIGFKDKKAFGYVL